ncbi:hypothetical protein LMJ53_15640 [Rheinheimera sp. UJ51]|uniref:hypothetical protein n=1 Tax=Rheinheimera sp. UJ51 TaxID=2892446 RepID=UPI001E2EF3C5|nr:hypothetical protein [Rheinheimera sp. UJ51]MCC5453153.1 hypothetical protein [Rheinheimera sp. UJ51]
MTISVRVFDTILDERKLKDTVSRNSADFWKPFCKSAGWTFSHERIHSFADLKYLMSRKIKEDVIIFSGHGMEDGFYLSNGDMLNQEAIESILGEIPSKNHGKIIIFSSCYMGKSAGLCQSLKDYFGARTLFAYQHLMADRFCFLFESILLSSIEQAWSKKEAFSLKDFEDFKTNTSFMKNMNEEKVKKHPMLMF